MSSAQLPFSGQQQFDQFNQVVPLARLFIFASNTTTPIVGYANKALTIAHEWPVEANGAGRFPAVFIDDTPETVRLVVTDAHGSLLYEDGECPVIGPARWAAGDTPVVDVTRLVQTGWVFWAPINAALPYTARCNGRTIGSAVSGATERAAAECEPLFTWLWQASTSFAVSGGRGPSAAADWAANKTIATPDLRGRSPVGLDTMGAAAANRVAGLTSVNTGGGAASHAMTVAQMPNHAHGGSVSAVGDHAHTTTIPQVTALQAGSGGGSFLYNSVPASTGAAGGHSHAISAEGSSEPFSLLDPYLSGSWFMKL